MGEPFFRIGDDERVNIDCINVIGTCPDSNYHSPVLSYRIAENDNHYTGNVVIRAWEQRRDAFGRLVDNPRPTVQSLLELRRRKTTHTADAIARKPLSDVVIGMPKMREAIARNKMYIYEGACRSVDESVAKIRAFAGAKLIGPPAY